MIQVSVKEGTANDKADTNSSENYHHPPNHELIDIKADDIEDHLPSDQVPTLAILEKPSLQGGSGKLTPSVPGNLLEPQKLSNEGNHEDTVICGGVGHSESRGKDVAKDGRGGLNTVHQLTPDIFISSTF